jgi:hypothetical protein
MMKLIPTIAFSALLACSGGSAPVSTATATGNRVGNLRGFRAIDRELKARILDLDATSFQDIGSFLEPGSYGLYLTGFRILLGGFGSEAPHADFQNGAPNAVNMLLWDVILSKVGFDVAQTACGVEGHTPFFPVRAEAISVLTPLCSGAATPQALQDLWHLVVGFEAPPEELDFFVAAFAGKTTDLKDLFRALFLNPHFLLET